METITRSEAVAAGINRFFTGKPCKRGHLSERWASFGGCIACKPAICGAWRKENKSKEAERYKKWAALNPNSRGLRQAKYRAAKRASKGAHTAKDIEDIRKQQKNKCACCKVSLAKRKNHVDHIIPLSKGGSNYRNNLQILCAACNRSKWATDPIKFYQSRGLLL